ncbi:AAA family ATPase [Frankia sp. Mgl5]|uniref:ATP-binding protein n=1 Tax=Frankia sp. Mgl5 TaxID=2933793 RepID=UPI00201001D2|nr:LuxR family transcriptional regulator [Frankia sp. Mgl5]MCK9926333.1 AAA family ATPase [Frankia sp. Mgl5]
MTTSVPAAQLIGREAETRALDSLVARVPGRGGAIVVRGEAGIGKSALLAELGRRAAETDMRILTTAGVESEATVAYGGLHHLLRSLLGRIPYLPGPQRDAILSAFGQSDAIVPDLFLIALATLTLLGEAAERQPVLLIVEDAHWLDRASADVMAFVARRLEFEPIILVVATRDGFPCAFDLARLPELAVRPLDHAQAVALLDVHAPGLRVIARARILAEALGNPLALIELASATVEDDEPGPVVMPLTARLERAFSARMDGLPAATRTLLLAAAFNDGDALAEIVEAGSAVSGRPLTADHLAVASDVRLISIDDARLRFRHPLVRSAIQQRATSTERQRAHACLAQVLTGQPDRQIWHRAAAATEPTEELAAELDQAAGRAHRRGGIEAAATALERAARLTPDPARRADRLLRAAELTGEMGRYESVLALLRQAETLDLSTLQRARVEWIRDVFDDGIRDVATGTHTLAEVAVGAADAGDLDLAMKVLSGAAQRCYLGEPGIQARRRVVAVAESVCPDRDDPRLLGLLGFVAPLERGAFIIERLPHAIGRFPGDPVASRLLGNAALSVGAFDVAASLFTTAISGFRAQGRLALLARSVGALAWCALNLIDLGVAISCAEESLRLATETSQPNLRIVARAHQGVIAAVRGDHDEAERIAVEVARSSLPAGISLALAGVALTRGLSALGEGRFSDAYEHLVRVYDPADPAYHLSRRCSLLGYLVEAALRSGRREAVLDVVAEMTAIGQRTPSPSLHAGLRYARALLADDQSAEALYRVALETDSTHTPFARARTLLAYGEWLRRQRRSAESRGPLRAAHDAFDALGTAPWSGRARAELRASGETSRIRAPRARDLLTSQELQIAQMAAEGLTNREIGQKLYLSHRTVSTHLYRIFPKLGVTSRSGLGAALAGVLEG